MMYPPLLPGDEIRIVAPSDSWRGNRKTEYGRGINRLESLGYRVTFGASIRSKISLGAASVKDRVKDLHSAYTDQNVKAIMALNGGWLANELLPLIDWQIIRSNPKPLIGFSDITALHNAIYAKAGLVGLLGPNLGTLGSMPQWQYTLDNLQSVLTQQYPLKLSKSQEWAVGKERRRYKTKPWKVIQEGEATGILLGGNIGTFYVLQGTEFQPMFDKPFVLAIEDDDEAGSYTAREFSRRLESILQQAGGRKYLRGIIIGRFQPGSKVKSADIVDIVASKNLGYTPVISELDFGHTLPMVTLPIGSKISIRARKSKTPSVILMEY